ncbi:MAG TPA: HD-GYP domain-containing protein [Spirochaetales bacterium]|nr:HD-GYP domain-containing protein [Spirochaetales bacterium]
MKRSTMAVPLAVFLVVSVATLALAAEIRASSRGRFLEVARSGFERAAEISAEGLSAGYFQWDELRDLAVAGRLDAANALLADLDDGFRYALSGRIEAGTPPPVPWLFSASGTALTARFPVRDSAGGTPLANLVGVVRLDAERMLAEAAPGGEVALVESGGRAFAFGLSARVTHLPLQALDILLSILIGIAVAAPVGMAARRHARFFYESKGLETIIFLFEQSDRFSAHHSRNVGALALFIGRQVGLRGRRLRDLYSAALLHDIGKISVPTDLLQKPRSLDAGETETVREHPVAGARILDNFWELAHLRDFVLRHHERSDGSGYPGGLAGDEIPVESRIIAVADVFEALTGERPYRSRIELAEAFSIMRAECLDRDLVDLLEARISEYPTFQLPRWARASRA